MFNTLAGNSMSAIEDIKQAREYLKERNWPKSREILLKVFPTTTNAKFIGELLRAAVSAQRTRELDLEEHLLWLSIEIYESGPRRKCRCSDGDSIACGAL